jgi:hypothetical protein
MRKIFSFFVAVMAVSSLSAKSIYLQVNDDWKSYGAVFFVHSWGGTADADAKLALVEGEEYLFSAEIPDDNNNLLFVRAQGESESIPWDTENLWTKTGDLVIPDGKDGYFVDAQGNIIPNRNSATNLVVASGNIDEKYASKELAEFGKFLQMDDFWNNQIEQIYVTKNRKGKRVVELVPRVGDQIVYLGVLDDYEKKLRKLRKFYDRAIGTVGWKKYAQVNLEYDNQIICTKRK